VFIVSLPPALGCPTLRSTHSETRPVEDLPEEGVPVLKLVDGRR
jgi:hypothetical protein